MAEREVADAVERVEAVVADRALVGEEAALEARMRPGRTQPPAGVAGVGREAERAVAAEAVGEIDEQGTTGERARVEPGEEAGAAAAPARLQPERPAAGADARVGAEAARIGEAEAQLGAGEVHVGDGDAEAGQILGHGEAGAAADVGIVDDDLVDRALAPLGPDRRVEGDDLGRQSEVAPGGAGAGHLLAVLELGLAGGDPVGDDEERTGDGLRAAPALGDRGLGMLGLLLAVVDEQPDGEQREGEQEPDQQGQGELGARRSFGAVSTDIRPLRMVVNSVRRNSCTVRRQPWPGSR